MKSLHRSPLFSAGLIGMALALTSGFASAATLINGNFEAPLNADSATNTFPSWSESNGAAAIKATTALADSVSALLTGTSGTTGTLSQTVDPITDSFTLGLSFAAVDPGGASPSTSNRSFQLLLTGTNGAQINLIVIRGSSTSQGSINLFGGSFQSIGSLADKVNFSSSLASPVVNTLTITGTVGGSYTVSTNGTTSGAVTFYQAGTAATPTDIRTVSLTTANSTTVNYVVDNITLVPEPTSLSLMGLIGVVGFASRRPRRHKQSRK